MSVYLSHKLEDEAPFTSVKAALEGHGIKCWDPRSMGAGSTLRSELHAAIRSCDLCVFIATKKSIESKWCTAELGAFWGLGKRVIMFIAESGVGENDMPPQFKGDLWTSNVLDVIEVARSEIEKRKVRDKEIALSHQSRLVSDLKISDFANLLAWVKSLPVDQSASSIMSTLIASMPDKISELSKENITGIEAKARVRTL